MRGSRLSTMLPALTVALAAACDPPTTPDDGRSFVGATLSMHAVTTWGPASSVDLGGVNHLNTPALEGCPFESPNGRTLFFASNRDGQIDIWTSTRESGNGAWGEPERLPAPVNSEFNDFCPTPLPGDGLLFVSTRPGGCGGADIYQTRLHPTLGWLDPEPLGCEVNSAGNEFSPSHVPAAGEMLFFSSDRGGQDDIYVTVRGPDGGWGSPAPVAELNFPDFNSARPNVSQDGRTIVFDSNRPGGLGGADVWSAMRASVHEPWLEPARLGPNVNTEFNETRASLSRDGKRLYFGSNRPGYQGDSDIFVAIRY